MANPEHVSVVKRGTAAIEEWRQQHPTERLNLNNENFEGMNLQGANLSDGSFNWARLRGADLIDARFLRADLRLAGLSEAKLCRADLGVANLSSAVLREANLRGADLSEANLSRVNLKSANLSEARLVRANISAANVWGANFENAIMLGTRFGDMDLSNARGLESIGHLGPSTIGIDTLFKSRGKIPEAFLRGCGVPDELITRLPALLRATEPIQFYSCFISYSHRDEEFCKRLHSRMRDEHVELFFAPEDMKSGEKIHEQIEQAIRVYDKLLLVLSDESMKSEWVKTEIRHARQREVQEGRRILFPIRLVSFETIRDWKAFDADTGKDMAVEIREYFIPDFSNWKDHDAFENAFGRLLQDLKASTD